LLAALGLLGLAAFLMIEPDAPRLQRKVLEFPRHARSHEIERREARKTLALPARVPEGGTKEEPQAEEDTPRELADPVLLALSSPDEMAIVLEAGALKDSPIGRMLLACQSPSAMAELEHFEQRTGFRPLEQLERIGITSGGGKPVVVLSGDFSSFDPSLGATDTPVTTIGNARVLEREEMSVAIWKGQLALFGDSNAVHEALARLEGEGPAPAPFPADEAYGEMYGSLSAASLSRLLPEELRERVAGAADRVLLHVDARDDLLLVADVRGPNDKALADLAQTAAGALSLGRLQAVREDDRLLVDLLDESRVIPSQGSFQLEVALPLATVERQLGECARAAQ
jgi:hypothetical protein